MEEAVVQGRAARALDQAGAEAHNNLGAALATAGRFDEAAEEISEALRISSTFSDAHRNLGLVRMKQGRDDEAIREFTDALRSAPMLADVHYNVAVLLARRGDSAEALEHLEAAVRLQPADQAARRLRGCAIRGGHEAVTRRAAAATPHPHAHALAALPTCARPSHFSDRISIEPATMAPTPPTAVQSMGPPKVV